MFLVKGGAKWIVKSFVSMAPRPRPLKEQEITDAQHQQGGLPYDARAGFLRSCSDLGPVPSIVALVLVTLLQSGDTDTGVVFPR